MLRDYWAAALDWVQAAAAGAARTRLLDLGAGTGTGAIGLAQRFPDAEVIALDVSPVSVAKIGAKADAAGLGPASARSRPTLTPAGRISVPWT